MKREQIEQWARECGAEIYHGPRGDDIPQLRMFEASIERFAALVSAHEREQWQADAQRWRDVVAQGSAQMHCLIGGSYSFNLPKDKAKADDFADNLPIVRDRVRMA